MTRIPLRCRLAILAAAAILAPAVVAEEAASGVDVVRWRDGLRSTGERVVRLLPAARKLVAQRLRLPDPPERYEIVVVSGVAAMREEAGAAVPEWAVGITQAERRRIILRADLLQEGVGGGLEATLRHEWVHASWASYAGAHRRRLPLWTEEGIAEEVGGALTLNLDIDLARAAVDRTLLDLAGLAERFPAEAHAAALAYAQSRSWIRRFVDEHGWETTTDVLLALGRADAPGDFASLVRERTGRGAEEWTIAWRDALAAEARPWLVRWLTDLDAAVFFVAGIVSIVGFFVLLRRRRRQMASLGEGDLPRD